MNRIRIVGLAGVLGAAALAAATAQQEAGKSLGRPYAALSGTRSAVTERECVRVLSRDAWAALWLRHLGRVPEARYDFFTNPAALPEVDFDKCMVIAVFEGRGYNCAGLVAVDLLDRPEALVFRFDRNAYQTYEELDEVCVFGFFIVPRSTKLVVLEDDRRDLRQRARKKPPVWQEYARLEAVPPQKE
jgi:hypothetical protein